MVEQVTDLVTQEIHKDAEMVKEFAQRTNLVEDITTEQFPPL